MRGETRDRRSRPDHGSGCPSTPCAGCVVHREVHRHLQRLEPAAALVMVVAEAVASRDGWKAVAAK